MTETKFALLCHPATPDPAVDGIAVCLRRAETGLAVAYRLDGRLAALRVPASGAPLPVGRSAEAGKDGREPDGLWDCSMF